jgi:toxin ParE1/3/4
VRYFLSNKAEEDIIRIFLDGVCTFGEIQAEKYHDELEKLFTFLVENPLANVVLDDDLLLWP